MKRKLLTWREYGPDNSRMEVVAGVMNKLMIAAPFVLVTTLGLHSRSSADAFRYTAYSDIENREISNYIPIVSETEKAFGNSVVVNEVETNKLADQWIAEARAGKLKDLRPITLSDSSRDGVKSEIVRASTMISDSLNMACDNEIQSKQYLAAARNALKAAEEAETVKGFDFSSLAITAMTERRSLQILTAILPKLDESEKSLIKRRVRSFYTSNDELKQMSLDVRVLEGNRETPSDMSEADVKAVNAYFAMSPEKAEKVVTGAFEEPDVSTEDSTLLDAMNEFRLGFSAANDTNKALDRFVGNLS